MRVKRPAVAALCAGLLSVLAACGSSADFSTPGGAGAAASADDPFSNVGGPAPSASASSDDASPSKPDASLSAAPDESASTDSGPVASGPTTAAASASIGGAPIRVTFIVQDTAGAGALTGANNPNSQNGTTQTWKALVAYVNANGGVGGRKIQAVGFTEAATKPAADRVADCKTITEDQKAQVVIDMNQFVTEDLWSCLVRHKVAYIGTASAADRTFLNQAAPYINTTYIALDRQMRSAVAAAQMRSFFTKQKVGVLMADDPGMHRAYEKVLKPELAKIGITPTIRYIGGSSVSDQQAASTNAELAFASAGVTRIMFFHNLLVYLSFTLQASTQHYYPQYMYTDYQAMAAVAAYYGKANKENENALAVSQQATQDDATPPDATAPLDRNKVSPGQRECLDILTKQTKKNYYDPSASGDAQASWLFYCDEFLLWWKAAQKIGSSYTPADTLRGLKMVGPNFNSPLQHSVDFSPGYGDGGNSVRIGKWNSGCGCWPAVSGWIKVPA